MHRHRNLGRGFRVINADAPVLHHVRAELPQRRDQGDLLFRMAGRYNVIFMVLTYFLPICSMSYTYVRVGIELWGSQSIGECTQRQLENIKSKRRVVKMMIVVVSIFAICWLPFHIYFIVTSVYPEINTSSYIQEVYLGIYWLAMSNSMYNPIIYCWMNSRFRRGFKQFFSCCPCVSVGREMLSRREVVTSRYSCSGSPETQCRIIRNGSVHIPVQRAAGEPSTSRHRNLLYSADSRTCHSSSMSVTSFRHTNKWRNGGGGMDPGGTHRSSNGRGERGTAMSVTS
ncbi:hypothetical protein J437_LFUL010575 [Ladona fulva]|uniref:G-protein coupled receptors family 1 profile domain-containing protein n=1 Tax=Ladona fulva TaxID=123851 RepID=A0A8K0K9K3_LADFU|nr:hypothetical protein J437_LFUL010575 [Ladona fulva]